MANRRRKYSKSNSTRSNQNHTRRLWQPLYGPCVTLKHSLQPAGISCMLVFAEGGKPENSEKNPRSREENQHKLNPVMASGPGIEPGPHWWEASAFTTAPSLLHGQSKTTYFLAKKHPCLVFNFVVIFNWIFTFHLSGQEAFFVGFLRKVSILTAGWTIYTIARLSGPCNWKSEQLRDTKTDLQPFDWWMLMLLTIHCYHWNHKTIKKITSWFHCYIIQSTVKKCCECNP